MTDKYRYNVMDFGATGNSTTDDTDAIQKCIDTAIGPMSDAATKPRSCSKPIYMPSGVYKTSRPLKFYSAQYINFYGDSGLTRIMPVDKMESVLDLNGVAYSYFHDFEIQGKGSERVDNAINYYWDNKTAYGRATRNSFERIMVIGTKCNTGFRVGKQGTGLQVDQTAYKSLTIYGGQSNDSFFYQHGMYIGDNAHGNNLIHHAYDCASSMWANGFTVNSTNFSLFGGSAGQNGVDFNVSALAYFSVNSIRSESSGRLLKIGTTGSHAGLYEISNIIYSVDKMVPDGEFIQMNANGNLKVTNLQLINGGAGSISKISAFPTISSTINIDGVSAQNSLENFFKIGSTVALVINGYYEYNDTVGYKKAIGGPASNKPVGLLTRNGNGVILQESLNERSV